MAKRRLFWTCGLIFGFFAVVPGTLDTSKLAAANSAPADDAASAFFAKHCRICHSGAKPKGDFQLDRLSSNFSDKVNRDRWKAVLEQLKTGAMPPKEKPRPDAQEVMALRDWITAQIEKANTSSARQGRVVLRRLNRSEYENTVRDLLGVRIDLKDLLPAETTGSGFDNNAESLHVSSFLMEQYLDAADRVLNAAIANGRRPWMIKKRFDIKEERSVDPKNSVYRYENDGVAIFSSWVSANIQVTLWNFYTHFRGDYRFKISAYAFQTDKPITFHMTTGNFSAVTEERIIGYYEVPPGKPTVIEFTERLEPKTFARIVVDGLGVIPPVVEKIGAKNYKGPGLVVQWVDIEGPLHGSWPPPSHRKVFGNLAQAPTPRRPTKTASKSCRKSRSSTPRDCSPTSCGVRFDERFRTRTSSRSSRG
jgi:hypothetical protein